MEAARICAAIAEPRLPRAIDRVRSRLNGDPAPAADTQLRLAAAIANRTLAYLS